MKLADRMSRLGTESAFEVLAQAKALEAQGRKIIHMEIGEPDFDTPAHIGEAAYKAIRDGYTHYGPSAGLMNHREAVAAYFNERYGLDYTPDNIVVAPGAKPFLFYVILALAEEGGEIIYPNPGFPVYESVTDFCGAKAVPLPLLEENDFAFTLETVESRVSPRTRLLILNYPHNPSAATVEPAFYVDVVKLARRYGLMVISDFAYADLAFDGYQPPSFLAAPGACDLGVEFTTMSKGYNMAGWRVGYCAGNAEMIRGLGVIKSYYDYGMFQAIQIAAIVALRHTEAAVEAQSALYQSRRDVLVEGLRRIGWRVDLPKAGMFVWAAVPDPWASRMNSMDFGLMLLEKGDVAVSPGSGFGPAGEGFMRLTLIENENRLRQAVRQIDRCLNREARV